MKAGLVISTYNQPQFLQLVLKSVLTQNRIPNEVLIADDGSGQDTKQVVEEYSSELANHSCQVIHCWQDDDGFRKTKILNQAIRSAASDYLIFSDGDMVLHPCYVSDHIALACPGRFTQGRRICLNESATKRHLQKMDCTIRPFEWGLNRRLQIVRNRWLMRRLSKVDASLKNSRGCNQAFWRKDLLRANGYEEQMHGWGREDSEICARLHNAGLKRIYARHWALAFHLYHPELSRDNDERNLAMLRETVAGGKIEANVGIRQSESKSNAAA